VMMHRYLVPRSPASFKALSRYSLKLNANRARALPQSQRVYLRRSRAAFLPSSRLWPRVKASNALAPMPQPRDQEPKTAAVEISRDQNWPGTHEGRIGCWSLQQMSAALHSFD
jgi:hypothetical protein